MSNPIPPFVVEFNKVIEECSIFVCITRDRNLQQQACEKLKSLIQQIGHEKELAIISANEDYANILLGCECLADALISEIKMWILLKDGRPDEAWDLLVAAQDNLSAARRAHPGFAHLDDNIRRLLAIEQLIFPPQVFLSAGMIVKKQTCSICGKEYEDCCHIKGRPYLGKFCTVTLIPSKIDHVAVVEHPANKRCRITKFSAEGGERNRMTWLIEPKNEHKSEEGASSFNAEMVLATPHTFEEEGKP